MPDPICLKTGYRGKKRKSCIYVHRPDLTGKARYQCPTCPTEWYRVPGSKDNPKHPDQNWRPTNAAGAEYHIGMDAYLEACRKISVDE